VRAVPKKDRAALAAEVKTIGVFACRRTLGPSAIKPLPLDTTTACCPRARRSCKTTPFGSGSFSPQVVACSPRTAPAKFASDEEGDGQRVSM
jgi:hypothetical protein